MFVNTAREIVFSQTVLELWVISIGASNFEASIDGVELYLLSKVYKLIAQVIDLGAELVYLVVFAGTVFLRLLVEFLPLAGTLGFVGNLQFLFLLSMKEKGRAPCAECGDYDREDVA